MENINENNDFDFKHELGLLLNNLNENILKEYLFSLKNEVFDNNKNQNTDIKNYNNNNALFKKKLSELRSIKQAEIDELNKVENKLNLLKSEYNLLLEKLKPLESFIKQNPDVLNSPEDAELQNQIAYKYYANKNYGRAFEWYSKAALNGNAYAQYCLGHLYENGYTTCGKDLQLARYWYFKSAEQNYKEAVDKVKTL